MANPLFDVTCRTCGTVRQLRLRDQGKADREAVRECHSCAMKRIWADAPPSRREGLEAMYAATRGMKRPPPSEQYRATLREIRKGRTPALGSRWTPDQKAAQSARLTGRSVSDAARVNLSIAMHRRHGTTPDRTKPVRSKLGAWAFAVIRRDAGRCVCCGYQKVGRKDIAAHHILSRAKHPELALSINNGVTLCVPCHTLEHSTNGIL